MDQESAARRGSSGFTLIEMLVATVCATIVLLGLFNFVSSLTASEVRSARSSTTTAMALNGINAMTTDIAKTGAIGYPASGAAGGDSLIVCTNWTNLGAAPGKVDAANGVDVYYYCWDTTDPAPNGNALLRRVVTGAAVCPTVPPACTTAFYGGTSVVASGIYRNAGNPIFVQDPKTLRAVRLRYSVGNTATGAVSAGGNGGTITETPITTPYDTEIILED